MKISSVEVAYTTSRPGDYPAEQHSEFAFLGRSNVGKSSLINSLAGRKKLARTSKAPGRTRAIHWYLLGDGQRCCYFVDLPGYGYAKVPRAVREGEWATLIETYLSSQQPLKLAIQLLDIRRERPTELDQQMIDWTRANGLAAAYVLTKADKLSRSRRQAAVRSFSGALELNGSDQPIPYSAVTGEGKSALWAAIDARI